MAASDLAVYAAQRAVAERGIATAEIEAIVVGTVTPDMLYPSTACHYSQYGFPTGYQVNSG